ncbi:unnamed protein product [Camellia sinensis]
MVESKTAQKPSANKLAGHWKVGAHSCLKALGLLTWTCRLGDTANIQHILNNNFSNFPKGPAFNRIFNILGNGIFNADSEFWETPRKTAMSLFNHHRFQKYAAKTSWNKVEKGLIPVFEHALELGTEMNLKELFQHFTFDSTCILVLGHDLTSLSTLAYQMLHMRRHSLMLRRLFYTDIYCQKVFGSCNCGFKLAKKRITELRRRNTTQMVEDRDEAFDHDLLTAYMMKNDVFGDSADKFLRHSILNLVFAGRDTTSAALTWFFWLVATNPSVENKIQEEIITKLHPKEDNRFCLTFFRHK